MQYFIINYDMFLNGKIGYLNNNLFNGCKLKMIFKKNFFFQKRK